MLYYYSLMLGLLLCFRILSELFYNVQEIVRTNKTKYNMTTNHMQNSMKSVCINMRILIAIGTVNEYRM